MTSCIINRKKYQVEHVFNMVGNYYFTDKHNNSYLVDAEDAAVWAGEEKVEWTTGIDMAIKYARSCSETSEEGTFWWKEITAEEKSRSHR